MYMYDYHAYCFWCILSVNCQESLGIRWYSHHCHHHIIITIIISPSSSFNSLSDLEFQHRISEIYRPTLKILCSDYDSFPRWLMVGLQANKALPTVESVFFQCFLTHVALHTYTPLWFAKLCLKPFCTTFLPFWQIVSCLKRVFPLSFIWFVFNRQNCLDAKVLLIQQISMLEDTELTSKLLCKKCC